jgi:hypothetical protein
VALPRQPRVARAARRVAQMHWQGEDSTQRPRARLERRRRGGHVAISWLAIPAAGPWQVRPATSLLAAGLPPGFAAIGGLEPQGFRRSHLSLLTSP